MASGTEKRLYRVSFINQGKVYEIFARNISQGALFGFIEVEDIVFGEKSAILVDPGEDAMKQEFEKTKRIFIPMHSVIRIDEMERDSELKPRVVALHNDATNAKKDADPNGMGRITPIYTPTGPGKSI